MLKNLIARARAARTQCYFPYRYYLEKNRCIFIHIPKSAGTSILKLIGKSEVVGRDHLPWYVYYKANPIKYNSYFKFSFIRNPWARVFSAYAYLRQGGNGREDLALQRIITSFSGFDDFVIRGLKAGILRNHPLFIPQSEFVVGAEQEIMVDYLGRYERLEEDFAVVARRLGIEGRLIKSNSSTLDEDRYVLQASIDAIAEIYAQDIMIFKYDFEK